MKHKYLVLSDSHGRVDLLQNIVANEKDYKGIFFCGDGLADLMYLSELADKLQITVAGNVDVARGSDWFRSSLDVVDKFKILTTHGDLFQVKSGSFYALKAKAQKLNARIVLFGHTHCQYVENEEIFLLNPGAVADKKYAILYLDDQTLKFEYQLKSI